LCYYPVNQLNMAKRKKSEDDQSIDNDSDNFGLPDIDYKPLETESSTSETPVEQVTVQETTTTTSYSYQPETQHETTPASSYSSYSSGNEGGKSKAPMVIGLIIGLVVVVAGALIYFYVYKPAADKARQEELAREEARKRKEAEEARLAREREEEERRRREAEANAKPAIGTIETLTDRTRRYYVVVSSAIDGDLIMDYAKKLSAKGTSTKIIPPFGKWKFYRLAIGDYDTFATAQTNADGAKGEYGDGVWVIKY